MQSTIHPDRVRYIKLGREGSWEDECLRAGTIRFGYGSASEVRFPLCQGGLWPELMASFINDGKDKGTSTRFANETRQFFEDQGSVLWITFIHEKLQWGFLKPKPAERHASGHGVFREVEGGWKSTDINGEVLTKDRLSGSLTKLAAYRGTSCNVDVGDYVVRRINGHKTPEVERAIAAFKEMTGAVLGMMKLLGPKDFETLIDLVFSTSGWRRLGQVGKAQKILDLDMMLPSTGERAFVQVKTRTNQAEFDEYVSQFAALDSYDRMFFVYHTGDARSDNERVTVIGPEKFAEMVVDAGLGTWLVQKVS